MSNHNYLDNIRMGLETLRSHKMRSILTVLGVIIGVVTVIVIASILSGMRSSIVGLVEEYGTENIYAFHLKTGFQGIPTREELARKPLTLDDAKAILCNTTAIEEVAYQGFALFRQPSVRAEGESFSRPDFKGVSSNLASLSSLEIAEGRFISDADDMRRTKVCVIGKNVVEALFPLQQRVVGREVSAAGTRFTIVGVLAERKNTVFGQSAEDNAFYIPYQTMRKLLPRSDALLLIAKARSGQLARAWNEIESVLRTSRGLRFDQNNNFNLNTADKMIEQFDQITAQIGVVVIAISAVGLLVGGIGVMNIMLVSVTERTREIGLRKAVGAKRRDIVFQFLFEAVTLTSLGGLMGILLAIGISYLLVFLLPELPAQIPMWAVAAGLIVSTGVGLIFGVWPAVKASRLDPIESLRYE